MSDRLKKLFRELQANGVFVQGKEPIGESIIQRWYEEMGVVVGVVAPDACQQDIEVVEPAVESSEKPQVERSGIFNRKGKKADAR